MLRLFVAVANVGGKHIREIILFVTFFFFFQKRNEQKLLWVEG